MKHLFQSKWLRALATSALALLLVVSVAQAAITISATAITGSTAVDIDILDNSATSLTASQGANNYLLVNTTDSSEAMSFGNATTNPSFTFLGSGNLTVTGGDIIGAGSESIDISEATSNAFTFTRNDSGTVTLTSADDDADAALVVAAGGTGALTLGDTGSTSTLTGTTVTVTPSGAGNDVTVNLVDNNTDSLDIQESTNNYINIATTDSAELITFGGASNPEVNFTSTANVAFANQTPTAETGATATLTPTSSYINFQCNRAGPGDTVITISETGARDGQIFVFVVDDQNNAGTCSFSDSAGVQATAGTVTLDDLDSIMFIYHGTTTAQWIQLATTNN